jgi:hypothetical protein
MNFLTLKMCLLEETLGIIDTVPRLLMMMLNQIDTV